jgi:hypothetical protein
LCEGGKENKAHWKRKVKRKKKKKAVTFRVTNLLTTSEKWERKETKETNEKNE